MNIVNIISRNKPELDRWWYQCANRGV